MYCIVRVSAERLRAGCADVKPCQGNEKCGGRCAKRVEWFDEDQCFVGSCPGYCHGDDEVAVYRELRRIVDERLEVIRDEDGALPTSRTVGALGTDHVASPESRRGTVMGGEDSDEAAWRPCRTIAETCRWLGAVQCFGHRERRRPGGCIRVSIPHVGLLFHFY